MRSLVVKLTLAFLLVGVMAVALVGVTVGLRTQNAYDRWMVDQRMEALSAALAEWYADHGSWAGADTLFERGPMGAGNGAMGMGMGMRGLSAALLDERRVLVLGVGEFAAPDRLTAADERRAIGLVVGGETVGWLVPGREVLPMARAPSLPEQAFVQRISRAILYGALGAVVLALALGAVLARTLTRPIRELTVATQAVAKGQLGSQVTVHSEDEIGQLAASFNRMSADLARTSEARKQMTADIAHELRNPLAVMVGYAEALQDGKLPGSPQAYAALHDSARHLQRLVDDLGTLALADAGELSLNRRPVQPLALLERAALAHMVQAQAAGVTLGIAAASALAGRELPAVNADPERISQVLSNLVTNALRYTPAGGRIELSAEAAPGAGAVLLRVRDTGAGIAPADLPFVFERFYRGDKARSPEHGAAGLGLAIARSVVESHGGTIAVDSAMGAGATFTVTLPAA